MILVMGVFSLEIKPFSDRMLHLEAGELIGRSYVRGTIGNNELVATSGFIGKVETATVTQRFIDAFSPDLVILTSGAGGISTAVEPGQVVIGSEFQEYDVNLPLRSGKVAIQTNESIAYSHFRTYIRDAIVGKIITGDQIVSNTEERDELCETYNAVCLDMDSAAFAKTAMMNEIPFVVIKIILDMCDENAEKDFNYYFERFCKSGLPAHRVVEVLRSHIIV